ncbi:hypothetical protein INT43_006738, partial [Umbelopsis isabellina]
SPLSTYSSRQMPICVECDAPVATLYTEYSKGNIRLTSCDNCNNFADKYIEYDYVIIFIDMLLHKPQAYRHLLFNRITYNDERSIERIDLLRFLAEYQEISKFLVFHIGVHTAITWLFRAQNSQSIRHNYIAMALVVSSFGKMLLILMVIWDYKQLEYSWLVSIIVLTSNIEALSGKDYDPALAYRLYQDIFHYKLWNCAQNASPVTISRHDVQRHAELF